jgi:hypothetical protein
VVEHCGTTLTQEGEIIEGNYVTLSFSHTGYLSTQPLSDATLHVPRLGSRYVPALTVSNSPGSEGLHLPLVSTYENLRSGILYRC